MVRPIGSRRAFSALSRGRRGRSGPIWIASVAEDPTGTPIEDPHVAYAIGTAVGSAVVRNRLRRRLRAVMRDAETAGNLSAGWYLVGASPAAPRLGFDELGHHVHRALARVP